MRTFGAILACLACVGASGAALRAQAPTATRDESARLGAGSLPALSIHANNITVSGLSAGAYFAVQMHVAFSSVFSGAGIIAGGPFDCARGALETAITTCMKPLPIDPLGPNAQDLEKIAQSFADEGTIDGLGNLTNDRVWIYSGTKDTVVARSVVKATERFYEDFLTGADANVTGIYDKPSEHSWPTLNYGSDCDKLKSPFINKCDYDASGDMLRTLYGASSIQPAGTFQSGNLQEFDQSGYAPSGKSVGSTGYVYIPSQCQSGDLTCTLQVVLHGCEQTVADIGNTFPAHIGLAEYAETNDMVLLFPQVKRSLISPYNPNGCFDWWGYTGKDYAVKSGVQMKMVFDMMSDLRGISSRVSATAQE